MDTKETDRIRETQNKTHEVKAHLKDNIGKLIERDQNLSDIDRRAEQLEFGAKQFHLNTGRVSRKMWWQNMKMWVILIIIISIILLVIVVIIIIIIIASNG